MNGRKLSVLLLCLALLVMAFGCAGDPAPAPITPVAPGSSTNPGGGSSSGEPPVPPPLKPFYARVADIRARHPRWGGWPELVPVPDQTLLVGQGDVCVNLTLFKGATLEALKPFIEVDPSSVQYNTADWEAEFKVQLRWDPKVPEQKADRMTFKVKKGAPLGQDQPLDDDLVIVMERRPEATFSVHTVGWDLASSPFADGRGVAYLAPGTHTFHVEFTKDVDHVSVEKAVGTSLQSRFRDGVGSPAWPGMTWLDARTLEVSAILRGGYYAITANGSVDCDGMAVMADGDLILCVKPPVTVYEAPIASPQSGRVTAVLFPGHEPQAVSGDGRRILAGEDTTDPVMGGDGTPQLIPWLYVDGETPEDLEAAIGRAEKSGFRPDGGIWTYSLNQLHTRATAAGKLLTKVDYDKSPSGWAVSGDGTTVIYLDRSAGFEDDYYSGQPVWLDLFTYHPETGETKKYERFTRMPCNLDFYGPVLQLAVDWPGRTAVLVDRSEGAHVARVDLDTGIMTAYGAVPENAAIAIAHDGQSAAVMLSDRCNWGLVDLKSGAVRDLVAEGVHAKFSPDGSRLAMTAIGGSVTLVDLATGKITDAGPGTLLGWSDDSQKVFVARVSE